MKKSFNLSSPTEFYLYQLAMNQTFKTEKILRVEVIPPSHNHIKNQKNLKDSLSSLNETDFDENNDQEKNWNQSFFSIILALLLVKSTVSVIVKTGLRIRCFLITSDLLSPSVRYIFRMVYRLNDGSYIMLIISGLSLPLLVKILESLARNWESYLISTSVISFFSITFWYIGGFRGIVKTILYLVTQIYRIPGRFYNFVLGFIMSIIRLGTSIINLFLNYEETYLFCLEICQRIFYSFLSFSIKVGKLGFNILIGIYLLVFLGCIIQLATMIPSATSSMISYFSRVRISWVRFTLFGITISIPTLNLATKADMSRKDKEKPFNKISLNRENSNKQKQTQKRLFLKQTKKTSKFTFLKRYKLIKIDKIPRLRILRDRLFKNRVKKDESNEYSTDGSS
jgi:hypothetical protein